MYHLFTFSEFFFIFGVDILFYLTICRDAERKNKGKKATKKIFPNRNDRDSPEQKKIRINRSVEYETFVDFVIIDLNGKKKHWKIEENKLFS